MSTQKVIESTQGVSSSSSSLTDAANVLITPPRALSSTSVSDDCGNVPRKRKGSKGKARISSFTIEMDLLINLGRGLVRGPAAESEQVSCSLDWRIHLACLSCPGPQHGEICGLSQSSRESPLQREAPEFDKISV